MTDPAPSTIARPSLPHQVLINLAGFLTCRMVECDRWPLALSLMAEVLPACPRVPADDEGAVPLLERLVRAADVVINLAPMRHQRDRAMDWALAMSELRAVLSEILWARACMAHGVMQPAPETVAS